MMLCNPRARKMTVFATHPECKSKHVLSSLNQYITFYMKLGYMANVLGDVSAIKGVILPVLGGLRCANPP